MTIQDFELFLQKYKTLIGEKLKEESNKIHFVYRNKKEIKDFIFVNDQILSYLKPNIHENNFFLGEFNVLLEKNFTRKELNKILKFNNDIEYQKINICSTVFISSFLLYEMPHCCGILLSCGSFVEPSYRKKNLGSILNNFRIDLGKYLDYSLILCTDKIRNLPQRKILENNKWKDIYSFKNKRTDNDLFISVKDII